MSMSRFNLRNLLFVLLVSFLLLGTVRSARADIIFDNGSDNFFDSATGETVGVIDSALGQSTRVTFGSNAILTGDDAFDDSLYVEDTSIAIINGGSYTNDVSAYNSGRIEINGGILNDDIYVHDQGFVQMHGGTLAEDIFILDANASMNLAGGNIGRDITVAFGSLTIRGGQLVFGGAGNLIDGLLVGDGGVVNFVGTSLLVDGVSVTGNVTQTSGVLSGTLADGSSFSGLTFAGLLPALSQME